MSLELPPGLPARLAAVRSLGVITGAGVSAESGIRTYRGRGGIYDQPGEGERAIEALTGSTLQRDPDRTWRQVAALAAMAAGAAPNAAHRAIAALEQRLHRCVLLTQNVDRLHQEAGSRKVIDIHGDLTATECLRCGARGRLESEQIAALVAAPRCTACDGVLRPGVVLFEEMLPFEKVARLRREFLDDPPDAILVVGTTALFPYIAQPVLAARQAGRLTVEVNPEATDLSAVVDHSLRGPAGAWLPRLAAAIGPGT